jgi:MFS family permease
MAKPRSWAGRTRGVEDSAVSTSGYRLSFVSRVLPLLVLVQVTSIGDIGALTSGAVEAADAARRGAALAVYAFSGYVIAFAGPVVAGVALDWFGDGGRPEGWRRRVRGDSAGLGCRRMRWRLPARTTIGPDLLTAAQPRQPQDVSNPLSQARPDDDRDE